MNQVNKHHHHQQQHHYQHHNDPEHLPVQQIHHHHHSHDDNDHNADFKQQQSQQHQKEKHHTIRFSSRAILLSVIFSVGQLVQEVISEQIFNGKTNESNSMASLALLYAFTQQMCCTLLAIVMLCVKGKYYEKRSPPSWDVTFGLALLIGMSSSFANWAVEFVFYPAKVVMKSTKLVPTMIVSPLLGNSTKFTFHEYISAIFLSIGAAGFALASGRLTSENTPDLSLAWVGLGLLTIAALGDALVPNLQQNAMRHGANPEELAIRVNSLSAFALLSLLIANGDVLPWLQLWFRDPSSLFLMILGGTTFAVAVLSYTFLIVEAGSVAAVGVATIRKVLTLMLSYLIFPGKSFTWYHSLSLFIFSIGLGWNPLTSLLKKKKAKKEDFV